MAVVTLGGNKGVVLCSQQPNGYGIHIGIVDDSSFSKGAIWMRMEEPAVKHLMEQLEVVESQTTAERKEELFQKIKGLKVTIAFE
tara:strand:- start:412 stop:666 length:255 start_codon:yes stop_codon:yes gene_type:complete